MSISTSARRAVVADPRKELLKKFHTLARNHRTEQVFRDFIEAAAIELSNPVDKVHWEVREKRYIEIFKRGYPKLEERLMFPQMFADLVAHMQTSGFEDTLGTLFTELELNNKNKGQFFTPYHLSSAMARMLVGDGADLRKQIAERGHITMMEPCCGAGGMALAFVEACMEAGIHYPDTVHVQAVDIDPLCVHMTYVQLSLRGVPAIVTVGDVLRMTYTADWYTPTHILGGWGHRLRRGRDHDDAVTWWRDGSIATRARFLTEHGLAPALARKSDPPAEILPMLLALQERLAIAAE